MIRARVALPDTVPGLDEALAAAGVEGGTAADGLVFAPEDDAPSGWLEVEQALLTCFQLTRQAATAGASVVYLVAQPALLGHAGVPAAMLAGALVSAARALAMEGQRRGVRANVLAYDAGTDADVLARWAKVLLELGGASGEVVQLGPLHHGKVRP